MENRQRSKTIFRRGVVVLTALALISCCFVGSTLGRYVTKKDGSFDSGVALWKITDEVTNAEGEVSINLDKISPKQSPAKITGDPAKIAVGDRRSKELTNITVKIKNEGDVNAYVMLDLGEVSGYQYVFEDGKIQTDTDGSRMVSKDKYTSWANEDSEDPNIPTGNENPAQDPNIPTSTEWAAIFTAEWGEAWIITPSTEEGQQDSTTPAKKVTAEGDYNGMYLVQPGETLSVKVTIKWNTDLATDRDFEKDVAGCIDADYRDTWIGENIGKISLAYSWYAVQGSEMPAENTQGN